MDADTKTCGTNVYISAKNGTTNFIYDLREEVDSSIEGVYAGAIHAECDLEIGGKGSLTVESKNNNGIHTKDDFYDTKRIYCCAIYLTSTYCLKEHYSSSR